MKGNENSFELAGGSSYRGFELAGVDCIFKIGKISPGTIPCRVSSQRQRVAVKTNCTVPLPEFYVMDVVCFTDCRRHDV